MNVVTAQAFVYQLPSKPLAEWQTIPTTAISNIRDVIENDEGGWVLTKISGDNDGGWTYGGMTARKFREYYPGITHENIAWVVSQADSKEALRQIIVRIYFQDYMQVAASIINFKENIQRYHLSCIVNCGPGGFEAIYRDSIRTPKHFLTAWKDYYHHLVLNDSSRYKFFAGWINRVWRYLNV